MNRFFKSLGYFLFLQILLIPLAVVLSLFIFALVSTILTWGENCNNALGGCIGIGIALLFLTSSFYVIPGAWVIVNWIYLYKKRLQLSKIDKMFFGIFSLVIALSYVGLSMYASQVYETQLKQRVDSRNR